MMNKVTINEASKILGVSKKTIDRWSNESKISFIIDPYSKTRYYDKDLLYMVKDWQELRNKHRSHIRKLKPIQDEVSKYIKTTPLSDRNLNLEVINFDDMKKAFDSLHKWEEESKKIRREYSKFDKFFNRIEPETQ